MTNLKPNFTDVDGRKIVTRIVEHKDFEYLSVELLNEEDGTTEVLMRLNMYDAKKLDNACEVFLQHTVAKNFGNFSGDLSPTERADLFHDDDV